MAFTPPSDAVETQEFKDVTSSTSSFKPPSDAVETKQSDIDWKNIGRTSVETVPSAAAGLAGFGAGMAAAAPIAAVAAPLTGPFAPVTAGVIEFAGGLGGAFIASGAAQKVTDWMHEAFAPEDYKARQVQKAADPYGTFAAQTLTNLAGMSPKTIPEVAGKMLTKPLVQRGVSAGLTGSIEAGSQYASEGKIDPIKVAVAAAGGAAMPGFNPLGRKAFEAGEKRGYELPALQMRGMSVKNTENPKNMEYMENTENTENIIQYRRFYFSGKKSKFRY